MHSSPGIVISALAVIGENLTLTGGNIIGAKPCCKIGEIVIGDNCTLDANALVNKKCAIDGAILVGFLPSLRIN